MPVAYRIETQNTVIRCYEPQDAQMLKDAIDISIEHLKPWMPWAHQEPQTLEEKAALLRRFRGLFDLDQDYIYGIFARNESELLGGTGLHTRTGERAREIGYWVSAGHTRRGIATEVVQGLVKTGFEYNDLIRIEIHCDPRNEASAAIPAKLGFRHEATLKNRLVAGAVRDIMIWTIFREDYEAGPIKDFPIKAYDCCGNEI